MADLNFNAKADLNTTGFDSGLKRMQAGSKSTSTEIQKNFSSVKTGELFKVPSLSDLGVSIGKSTGLLKDFSTTTKYTSTGLDRFLGGALKNGGAAFDALAEKAKNAGTKIGSGLSNIGAKTATGIGNAAVNGFFNVLNKAAGVSLRTDEQKALAESIRRTNEAAGQAGTGGLPTLRYALYDIAGITQRVADGMLLIGSAALKASMEFETAFTDIERTTLANERRLQLLNMQFKELATQIPLTFKDITKIGSLGAQLGLADSELSGFSKTVAQFAATTNVSTESAAQSFGALAQLLGGNAKDFDALGSAIAYVGINSVATETEVLSVATAIGGVAAQAGISAEYVIGLSGSLASLRVPAEQSRGALTRVFQEVNRAAAGGVEGMAGFASIMGISAEQALNLAKTDMAGFFTQFVNGLSGLDSQQLTTTLDSLELADIRVTNVLARLSQNNDVLAKSLADSGFGFENSAILSQLYGNRVEDLAAKMQILSNSFQEFLATMGDTLGPIVGPFIDAISDALNALSDALTTDAGKNFAAFATVIVTVIGVLSALTTGFLLTAAGIAAMRTALTTFNPALKTATVGGQGFIATLFGVNSAAVKAAGGITTAGLAARGFQVAMAGIAVLGIIQGIMMLKDAFDQAAQSADIAFKNMISDTSGLAGALSQDAEAYRAAIEAGNTEAMNGFIKVNLSAEAAKNTNEGFTSGIENMYEALDLVIPKINGVGTAFEDNTRIVGDATRQWIINSLLASEAFQKLFESTDFSSFIKGITDARNAAGEGFSISTLIDMQAAGATKQDMLKYMYELQQIAIANNPEIKPTINFDSATGQYSLLQNALGGFYNGASEVNDLLNSIMGVGGAYYLATTSTENLTNATGEQEQAFGSLGNAASSAAKKIYLLTDYANDLSSIWDRARDIRFSGTETLDNVTKAFLDIAEATENARIQIQEISADIQSLNADIDSLTADRALQEYFLSVAEAYGDSLKAGEIRANLAKIDADLVEKNDDLAKKTKDLQKAQDKTNKTLIGNSDAAIENRSEILDLVKSYQDHVKALAESGMKQDELRAKSQQLKADFIAQAAQLGYNVDELGLYAAAFDDVKAAIDAVPRDVTVDFNGDPALTAIEEFSAKARDALNSVSNTKVSPQIDNTAARALALQGRIAYLKGQVESAVASKNYKMAQARDSDLATHLWALNTGNYSAVGFADGGYTGPGGKYDVAGIVHRGEYVVPKEQVNQMTGLPYFMSQPRTFAQGGYTGQSGPSMVSLSPEDRALLRNVGGSGNIVLYADSRELARSVNDGNRQIVAQGGRP